MSASSAFAIRHPLDADAFEVRVLCAAETRSGAGSSLCRFTLATIFQPVPGSRLVRLYTPNGYREDSDGVWRFTAHAIKRLRHNSTPRDRKESKTASARMSRPVYPRQFHTDFPFEAVCPKCNQRRIFDAAVLGLGGAERPD